MFTNTTLPAGRTRRSFTRAFKAEVAAQCLHSGESLPHIAQQHDINPSLLRKWLRNYRQEASQGTPAPAAGAAAVDHFVPLMLAPSSVPLANAAAPCTPGNHQPCAERAGAGSELRIELCRGEMTLTVHWPISHAQDSATWVRQVLA